MACLPLMVQLQSFQKMFPVISVALLDATRPSLL
jgi:hypothetical protein